MAAQLAVDWTRARKAPETETIARATVEWLVALPTETRPKALPVRFPRVANGLASRWSEPQRCLAYLEDLLIDKRGNRRGFPIDVLHELAGLKNYYESVVHRTPQTVWDEVSSRLREA
jgi:hypothetical protein